MTPKKTEKRNGPPLILAIETATLSGSVALVADGQCLAEYTQQSNLTHSRRLLSGINRLLVDSACNWDDIDGVAVSLGPGSFTGLRIGISTAKGLAMAADKPLLGVPTLDGLAAQFYAAPHLICPVLDARRQEVYAAIYRGRENGRPERISEYMVSRPEKLCEMIRERVIMVGDGLTVYREIFQEALGELLVLPRPELFFPRAAVIGRLAVEMWQRREFVDLDRAAPIYIRPSEAELNFADNSGQ